MREIEIKVKIAEIESAINFLKEKGVKFSEEIDQYDRIFLPNGVTYDDLQVKQSENSVLRLREQNGKVKFTLKQTQSMELDCLEAETVVEDPVEMEKAINMLGFYLAIEVRKKRKKGKLGELTFCVDQVEDLGGFVEVEKLFSDEVDAGSVQKELFDNLLAMGLEIEEQVFQGYDTLRYFYLKENSSD